MKLSNFKTVALTLLASAMFVLSGCGSSGTASDRDLVGGSAPEVGVPYTVTTHVTNPVTLVSHTVAPTDGTTHAHTWTQVTGVPVTIANGTTANAHVTPSATGTVVVQHTVTNTTTGAATTSHHTIVVVAPPASIQVHVSYAATVPGGYPTSIHASIAGGTGPYSYVWVQTTGITIALDTSTHGPETPVALLPILSADELIEYTLEVTDSTGLSVTHDISFTILAGAPTATPPTVTPPTPSLDTTAPVFTSPASASSNENQTDANLTLVATDANTVTYSISGTDASSFSVDASTGVLTFITAPDFETKDSYAFTATATDPAGNATTQDVTITILDVNEGIIHNGVTYGTVVSPFTAKIWLDRNLGAAQVCSSLNDTACYGDYYQWGRNFDGHQDSLSGIISTQATDVNNAGTSFIAKLPDWTTADSTGAQRITNWSKADGTSVCPIGFRVPTETELKAETSDNGVGNSATAFANFLKLPIAGHRWGGDGDVDNNVDWGTLWVSSVALDTHSNITNSRFLLFNPHSATWGTENFAYGKSVRCIKN